MKIMIYMNDYMYFMIMYDYMYTMNTSLIGLHFENYFNI